MVHESQITFLIAGRLEEMYAYDCVHSVRISFPHSEIIIATWNDFESIAKKLANQFNIKYVCINDVGSEVRKLDPITYHNANRMIAIANEGMKHVKTKYVFKMRSDLTISSNKLLKIYNEYRNINFNILKPYMHGDLNYIYKERLLISNITTIDADIGPPLLYHPCDWFIFGNTEDIKFFFDIDFISDEECKWYEHREKPENKIDHNNLSRYMAEDYIGYMSLRKTFNINHDFYCDYNLFEHIKWKQILGGLFIVIEHKENNISSLKYRNFSFFTYKCITHLKWKLYANHRISFLSKQIDKLSGKINFFLYNCFFVLSTIKSYMKIILNKYRVKF
jgi:hypothetical protein